jgi:hypothetical protein
MEPNFIGFTFEPATEARASLGGTRIMAVSQRSISTNTPLRAWVGTQQLAGVTIDQFGLFVEGWIENPPDPSDTLFYQVPGTDKIDTGLTADEEPPIV